MRKFNLIVFKYAIWAVGLNLDPSSRYLPFLYLCPTKIKISVDLLAFILTLLLMCSNQLQQAHFSLGLRHDERKVARGSANSRLANLLPSLSIRLYTEYGLPYLCRHSTGFDWSAAVEGVCPKLCSARAFAPIKLSDESVPALSATSWLSIRLRKCQCLDIY